MKKVIILRGIPGSGKSRWTNCMAAEICSADNFFMTDRGEYAFDPSKLAEAHSWCFSRFLDAVKAEAENIIVDNTNITIWQCENYIRVARLAGYAVQVVEFVAQTVDDIRICIARNQHGVPSEIIARMAVEFESLADRGDFVENVSQQPIR